MLHARLQCHHHLRREARCPDHGDVAQPLFMAMRWMALPASFGVKGRFVPCEQFGQSGIVETVAHGEIRLDGLVRKTVPRADQLAIVAAVDAVANERTQFDGMLS